MKTWDAIVKSQQCVMTGYTGMKQVFLCIYYDVTHITYHYILFNLGKTVSKYIMETNVLSKHTFFMMQEYATKIRAKHFPSSTSPFFFLNQNGNQNKKLSKSIRLASTLLVSL